MNIPAIKDLIKNNTVGLNRYKSGNLFYRVTYAKFKNGKMDGGFSTFEFPVPILDVGEAEMKGCDKAIYFMRYIKRAIEDKTFIEIIKYEKN